MPKLKTRKSVAKRIALITKNGKILRRATSAQHRTTGKSKRTLRQSKMKLALKKSDAKSIRSALPYGV